MRQALRLASRARGRTSPNPLVGCVIVRDRARLATGLAQKAAAITARRRRCASSNGAPRATVYVTLEPHGFHGARRRAPIADRSQVAAS